MTMRQRHTAPFHIVSEEGVGPAFEQALGQLLAVAQSLTLSRQTRMDLMTAFFEAAANAIRHAGDLKNKGAVEGFFFINATAIGFQVFDHGRGFNLDKVPVPDFSDLKGSGRGVFMMKQLGDELTYRKSKRRNVLTFKRYLVGHGVGTRDIDLLYALSEAAIRGSQPEEIYRLILDQALEIFRVERASILALDSATGRLKVMASRGIAVDVQEKVAVRAGEGVSGYVFQHGRPLLVRDIKTDQSGLEQKAGYKSRSFMSAPLICAPLRPDEKPIGVINLTDRIDGKPFTRKDLKLLSTIANQAMASVYVRELADEARRAQTLAHELAIVRNIQSSYLPEHAPKVAGYDFAGDCEMAKSVGGDYFDFFHDGQFCYTVVADVSGHDIASATAMFNFRSQLRAFLSLGGTPAEIFKKLAKTLGPDLERTGHFVTALLLRLNTSNGEYLVTSAGHYPPLGVGHAVPVIAAELPVGLGSDEPYVDTHGKIGSGEGLVLFTDGAVEAANSCGELFGVSGLEKSVSGSWARGAQNVVGAVIDAAENFSATENLSDDITVVVIQRG